MEWVDLAIAIRALLGGKRWHGAYSPLCDKQWPPCHGKRVGAA